MWAWGQCGAKGDSVGMGTIWGWGENVGMGTVWGQRGHGDNARTTWAWGQFGHGDNVGIKWARGQIGDRETTVKGTVGGHGHGATMGMGPPRAWGQRDNGDGTAMGTARQKTPGSPQPRPCPHAPGMGWPPKVMLTS